MARWDPQTTLKFVRAYKSHECLWNFGLQVYKNKSLRDSAIQSIVEAMGIPEFGTEDAKLKIKNLRSTYNQEKKKIEYSLKNANNPNDVYKPNIKWYDEFDEIFIKNSSSTASCLNDMKRVDLLYPHDGCFNMKEEEYVLGQEFANESDDKAAIRKFNRKRKRHLLDGQIQQQQQQQQLQQQQEELLRRESPFDIFGKSVAAQLKTFSHEAALMAQSQIQSILTEIGIQELTRGREFHHQQQQQQQQQQQN